jgi:hypothetical protein
MEAAVLDDSARIMTAVLARRIPLYAVAAAVLVVAWALAGVPGRAAETTAVIVGYVRTAAGMPLAGASVVALSPSGRYDARTNAQGRFTLLAVAADTYAITVDARGFAVQQQRGVTVNPGATARVDFALAPALREIGRVSTSASNAFTVGAPQDTFTVTGAEARGPATASGSGLATYARGTVQGAVVAVPGVQQDQFANVILRGGKVDDVAFSYDAVPIPQAIIAEPGGNVIGAQLPTTGLGFTTVTTGGFATASDDALGGLIDEVPQTGVYPAQTLFSTGIGAVGGARDVELQRRWATPSLRQRYSIDAQLGSQTIGYGDGRTFYPAEAATYGLSLNTRATWSVGGNVHLRSGARDDVELLALAGEATYDQYGTPFAGLTYGTFNGAVTAFPGASPANALVTTPTRIRGTYAIEKVQLLRTYDHSYARLRLYRSQYGSSTSAPFFDDLSFPNGVISYSGRQSGVLSGFGFDAKSLASERHQIAYGFELRRQTSMLDQIVPTLDQRLTSNPVLRSALLYVADAWSPSPALTLQGALRARSTQVVPDGRPRYTDASLDPHVSAVAHLRGGALRFAYDHTTVPPKPLQTQRIDSTQPNAPFVPLAPERGDAYELSYEHGDARNRLRLTLFSKAQHDRIDVIPTDFRNATNPGTAIGVPQNVGSLLANGAELGFTRGPLTVSATYVHARSSSASQFGLNDLNAPAIAANHLFPVGYVPDLSAVASYRFKLGRLTLAPALSFETGYPYGNGRKAWVYDANGTPSQVLNDNHVNPGYNYYFLRDPSLPYDAASNPIVSTLGTREGDDPNTLRSAPLLLLSLHAEQQLSPRVTLALDVANVLGTATPTQLQSNPYLIGPPGYTGGDAQYAAWYGQQLTGAPYTLGNGVPTNDGRHAILPWRYGTGAYVPSSYPEARSVYLKLRVTL